MSSTHQEYEENGSAEAKFVKELDRLDMVLQAHEYECRDRCPGKLQEFFDSTAGAFRHPLIRSVVDEIVRQRGVHHGERSDAEGHAAKVEK